MLFKTVANQRTTNIISQHNSLIYNDFNSMVYAAFDGTQDPITTNTSTEVVLILSKGFLHDARIHINRRQRNFSSREGHLCHRLTKYRCD
jgi:hypothetical protein